MALRVRVSGKRSGKLSGKHAIKARLWGSVYEQPALSETASAFLAALGPGALHWLPTGILARPNTGQLGLYTARVASGRPAAPLVHINPLKDWSVVEALVLRSGCAAFPPFRRPGVDDWKVACPGAKGKAQGACAKGKGKGNGGRAEAAAQRGRPGRRARPGSTGQQDRWG